MTVVTDPSSRLTLVTVVSVLPVVDVVKVVAATAPALSGNTIVVFGGGAAWFWAATGRGHSIIRPNSRTTGLILNQRLAAVLFDGPRPHFGAISMSSILLDGPAVVAVGHEVAVLPESATALIRPYRVLSL